MNLNTTETHISMVLKRNRILTLLSIGLATMLIIIYSTRLFFYKEYLLVFNKSGSIAHFNRNGNFDGEVIEIKDGKIAKIANYRNGKKTGWTTTYYPDGKIKNRMLYFDNYENGPAYEYYANGIIKSRCTYKNGERFGNLYWYFEDGKINDFAAYDINGNSFCHFQYNQLGMITKMEGFVVSPNIYSINTKDSIILLDFNLNKPTGYIGTKDLYIVVAKPPNLDMKVTVSINNIHFNNLPIKNGLMRVPNVFNKREIYRIFIESHLFDKYNKIVNGINVERRIKVDQ